jgi:hypothetical protein
MATALRPPPRPDRPHSCSSMLLGSIATGHRHRGSRRGARPSYAGTSPDPTRDHAADETDALPENVVALSPHRVQSTACSNAYAERWIGSVRRECLARFIPLGERHSRQIVRVKPASQPERTTPVALSALDEPKVSVGVPCVYNMRVRD